MGFKIIACALLAATSTVQARKGAGTSLDPVQPVLLPDGDRAKNPLAHLGGNGPWTAGMGPLTQADSYQHVTYSL